MLALQVVEAMGVEVRDYASFGIVIGNPLRRASFSLMM